jgi:hypothetical protein
VLFSLAAAARAQDPAVIECIERFPPGAARAQCVTPWLDGIVMHQGVPAALGAAEGLVKSGVMNVNDCHIMGHAIGHAGWNKEHDLARAFNACSLSCIQGCMHGTVEAFMIDGPPAETKPARVRAFFCDTLKGDLLKWRQCLHGLGHGVAYQHRKDVQAATNACESVGGRLEADLCLGGLWMQRAHLHIHKGADAYARIAPQMCEGVKDDLLPECARAVGGGAMFASGHDPTRASAICKLLPPNQLRDCERGVDYEFGLICEGLSGTPHN